MSFSKKLKNQSCIFCGAPLTSQGRCNYCGCEYLQYVGPLYKEIQKLIELPDTIIINEVYLFDANTQYDHPEVYNLGNKVISLPSIIRNHEVNIRIPKKYLNEMHAVYQSIEKHNFKIHFKGHTVMLKDAFIKSITTNCDYHDSNFIDVGILPQEFYIL